MIKKARGYSAIGLRHPKTSANIGSVLRAAGCFDATMVAIDGHGYTNSKLDTTKSWRHRPLLIVDDIIKVIPHDCVVVGVELLEGSRNLKNYIHPERAFYVFGPEDGCLDDEITSLCRDIIYIDTPGPCMNLAACANVVLYDRLVKQKGENNE